MGRHHCWKITLFNSVRIDDRVIYGRAHDLAFSGGHRIDTQTPHKTVTGNEQEKGNGQTDDDARHLDRDQSAG
ncbi:hypothetical protein D3C73_1411670 [compost metagenome]